MFVFEIYFYFFFIFWFTSHLFTKISFLESHHLFKMPAKRSSSLTTGNRRKITNATKKARLTTDNTPVTPQTDANRAVTALLGLREVTPNASNLRTHDTRGSKKKTPGGHDNESHNNVTPGDTVEDLMTEGRIPAPSESLTQVQTGAEGTTRKKKRKGMTQAAPDVSQVRDEELARLREHLAALQRQEKAEDTPRTAEMKAIRATIAEYQAAEAKKTATTKKKKNAGTTTAARINLFHIEDSEEEGHKEETILIIPFEDHDDQLMESMIIGGAPIFGAMKHKAPLSAIAEGMIICLALPTTNQPRQLDSSHTANAEFEFMQVGRFMGTTQRALVHVATSRSTDSFPLTAQPNPTIFLAPINKWYFMLSEQALEELSMMSHVATDAYQLSGKCQKIPVVIADNRVLTDLYGSSFVTTSRDNSGGAHLASNLVLKDTATRNPPIHGTSTAWSEEVHIQERDSIPRNEAHLYYDVSMDSVRRSKELMKVNPDMRVDKTFHQSKTADSLANKGMNLTVAEIISASPHDATRRLQHELLGRYFRHRKTYMPQWILIKLASSWSLPLGAQGIFYFMDLVPEFGAVKADIQIRLHIQPKAAECLTSVTSDFTSLAATHKKIMMQRFTATSAHTVMLNLVFAISVVHDMKYKFQLVMIRSVRRLFTYIDTHTLGNHTAKNVQFIKSSMILLADAWETLRVELSIRGKSGMMDILAQFEQLPDLSPPGLIAQTRKQLQAEDSQSTIRLLLDEICSDQVKDTPETTKPDKPVKDRNNKKPEAVNKDKTPPRKTTKNDKSGTIDTEPPSTTSTDTNTDIPSQKLTCIFYCTAQGCPRDNCAYTHALPTSSPRQYLRVKALLAKRKLKASAAFKAACPEETN